MRTEFMPNPYNVQQGLRRCSLPAQALTVRFRNGVANRGTLPILRIRRGRMADADIVDEELAGAIRLRIGPVAHAR